MKVAFDLVLTWARNEAGSQLAPRLVLLAPLPHLFTRCHATDLPDYTRGRDGSHLHKPRGCESVMARLLNFRAKARVMCV